MTDPLKARLEKLRKISESAKRRANLYVDVAKMDGANTTSSLSALKKPLHLEETPKDWIFDVVGS